MSRSDSPPLRDAYQDYRPDPEWTIESHLDPDIDNSSNDRAIPAFARQLEGALDNYHAAFCEKALEGATILPPPGWPDDADHWSGLSLREKLAGIPTLSWTDLAQVAMTYYNKKDFDARKLGEDKEVRPYLVAMLTKMPNWFHLKDYFLEGKERGVAAGSLKILRETIFQNGDQPEDEAAFKKRCRNTMGGFYSFRNHYVNGMIGWLRVAKTTRGDRGRAVNIVSASVGSEDLTSDYDLTLSGPDDVPAAAEFNRAFRRAWTVEAGTLFDTNVYFRGWMLVDDKEMQPMPSCAPAWKKNTDTNTPLQAAELDFFGDIFGLVKIRRYCEPKQWTAFVQAIRKGIEEDRRKNAADPAKGVAGPAVEDIPRFKRLDLVDRVYNTQFLTPLLKRLSDVKERYRRHLSGQTMETRPDALLEHLIEFDKNAVIRAMNIAFIELGAKTRIDEQKLREKYPGDYKWIQSGVDGKPAEKNTGLTLHGLVTFLERNSEMTSESSLFANEPYFTQGAIWVVVGGQAGQVPHGVTVEHYLQSFNEQLGDSLKELQEYLREFEQEKEEAKANPNAMNGALDDYYDSLEIAVKKLAEERNYTKLTAIEGKTDEELAAISDKVLRPVALALLEWRKEVRKYYGKMTKTATGFYRASKYELRLREMLLGIHDKLKEDPAVKTRNQKYKLLFPDRNTPDNTDLMLLTQESVMAGFYDKYVKQLLDIRKGRESYQDFSPRHRKLASLWIDTPKDAERVSNWMNDNLLLLRNRLSGLKNLKTKVEDLEKKGKPPIDRAALKSAAEDTRQNLDLIFRLFLDERVSPWISKNLEAWKLQVNAIVQELRAEIETLGRADQPVPSQDLANTVQKASTLVKAMTDQCEALTNTYRGLMGMRKVRFQGAEKEEAGKIMQQALTDANFKAFREDTKRERAKVVYEKAHSEDDEDEEIFGLAELIDHLLWHGALVNQLYRSIRSRGPVDLYVRHLALE